MAYRSHMTHKFCTTWHGPMLLIRQIWDNHKTTHISPPRMNYGALSISSSGMRTARYRKYNRMWCYLNVYLTVSPTARLPQAMPFTSKYWLVHLPFSRTEYTISERSWETFPRPFTVIILKVIRTSQLPDKSVLIMFWVNLIEHLVRLHNTKEDLLIHWTIQV